MKKKKFSIKEEYKKSWEYLKESKIFIWIVVGIFFVFALIGFFVPIPEFLSNQIMDFIKKLIEQTSGMSRLELINFIFFNNLQSSFYGLILGVILGIFPVTAAIANGYILGFVSSTHLAYSKNMGEMMAP